jgi:hypothetical protein
MKSIVFASLVALSMAMTPVFANDKKDEAKPAEVKKVCIDKVTKDGKPVLDKAGKQVQECKEMKVHKKLEGTKVPERGDKK